MDPGDIQSHFGLVNLLRSGQIVLSEPDIQRIERSVKSALASRSANPIASLTLALARAAQATEQGRERAIQWALQGLEEAEAKARGVMAMLAEALRDVLREEAERRVFVSHPITLLDRLPPYSAIEVLLDGTAAFTPDEADSILEKFRSAATSDAAANRLLYLEALLLWRAGDQRGAAERLAMLTVQDGERPEPLLALSRCLRSAGEPAGAAQVLRNALQAGGIDDAGIWNAWAAVSLADLSRKPMELADDMPRMPSAERGDRAGDIRWLLEKLAVDEPIQVNCGGDDYTGPDGKSWSRDRFYRGGNGAPRPSMEIAGTTAGGLYLSQRCFPWEEGSNVGYAFPLPSARYQVSLHFAETWYHASGLRRFTVAVQGTEVLKDYEPISAGYATADVKTFTADVTNGLLEIRFVHGAEDLPSVGAIEIERIP
jgi:hypothetical protein